MRILAVDTTSRAGSVAVLEALGRSAACRLLGVVATQSDEAYSTRLFRQLEFLLGELNLTTADFDLFAVAAGPGSFTGLRVGLTAVKGWAEIHQKPIAAVSALEAIACQVQPPHEPVVAVEDARRGQIYGGIYAREGEGLRRVTEDVVMSPTEFWPLLASTVGEQSFVFATTTSGFLQATLDGSPFAGRDVVPVSSTLAAAVGQLGWHKARRAETCDALTLDAHYVRRSDAEMLFKG